MTEADAEKRRDSSNKPENVFLYFLLDGKVTLEGITTDNLYCMFCATTEGGMWVIVTKRRLNDNPLHRETFFSVHVFTCHFLTFVT